MSDLQLSPIGQQPRERPDPMIVQQESKPVATKKQPAEAPKEPSKQPAEAASARNMYSLTSVQFKVDNKTNDIVILIKEKDSEKVLRTIPAEAIKDLPPGQLIDIMG